MAMALMLASHTLFAEENAVDSFKSILPIGTYKGNGFTSECFVTVEEVNFPDTALKVTVKTDSGELFKLIKKDSTFGINVGRKFYLQSDRKLIGPNQKYYVENILRTVDKDKTGILNVYLSEVYVIESHYDENTLECNLQN
jgi:hypothetical protein